MRRTALILTASLLLAACGDDSGSSDPIALEDGAGSSDAGDAGEGDAGEGDDPAAPAGDGDDGATTEPEGGVVDASVAEPGTWQVGEAGTVTFSLQEGRLVLDDVSPADGWTVTEQEADGDEIEVDLVRGDQRWDLEIELDDGRIDVERQYRVTGDL